MAYKLLWKNKGVYIKYSGKVNFRDLVELQGRLIGDKRYDSILYEIADLTNVEESVINKKEVKAISTLDKAATCYHREKQHIIVSDKEEFLPLIKFYFKTFEGTSWETHLFSTLNEAIDYLRRRGITVTD
jgi:hypothetical protein